ncbi:MAG TPA: DNA polymerase I [Campylobacterales bacterium]|nr:DNA polymerase I [Campylobacterales bacterium]
MEAKKIYIIDTMNFLFRTYYAIPPLYNRDGKPTNLLTGFTKLIQQLQKVFSIQNLLFALESKTNFRKSISENYKSNRSDAPEDFRQQVDTIISWLEKMNFSILQLEDYEADDVIASTAVAYSKKGYQVYILSEDKDFIQLLSSSIHIIKPSTMNIFSSDEVVKKFGVPPSQFIYYQSLVGDRVDNIPGVPGIGPKWAVKLLSQFHSLDSIYQNLDKIPKQIQKKLEQGRESAYQSLDLVTLRTDLEIPNIHTTSSLSKEPLLDIVDDLVRYEIDSALKYLIKKGVLPKEYIESKEEKNFKFQIVTITDIEELEQIVSNIEDGAVVAFDTETTDIDTWNSKIVGFSFSYEIDRGYYIPINHNYLGVGKQIEIEELIPAIERFQRFKVIGHNIKFDKHVIYNSFQLELPIFGDTMILAWLFNPSNRLSLDELSYKFLKYKKTKFRDIVSKGENFSNVDIGVASKYGVEDAVITLRLFLELQNRLPEYLFKLGIEFESKISNLLFQMEREGISVDMEYLSKLEKEIERDIKEVEETIYQFAGEEFNLNSPKQVADIFYGKLQIPNRNRKTDEVTLSSFANKYPIVERLLTYRKLSKLLSTYIRPLKSRGAVGKIHTTFKQTGTATGRFSSQNPNLQNIPVDSTIRNIFTASSGYSLLSLDYSQIELRLLAHFSNDEDFINLFQQNKDIHSIVAERLHVDRRVSKVVNFGLIYGMGYKKLASTLQIKEQEAKEILGNYFQMFPNLLKFKDEFFQEFDSNLYVETLLKRKRYFQPPTSKKEKNINYREAFNTLFQGSTADIVKLAMVQIDEFIKEERLEAKLLLQIHDELLFEVKTEYIEVYSEKFRDIMENVYPLNVPLVVNSKSGFRWGELK